MKLRVICASSPYPETTKLETIHVSSAVFFAADHTHIKVKLEGEKLSVFVGTSGDEENTTVFNAFTHINSAIYALFPKITVDKNSTVTLHKYSGVSAITGGAAMVWRRQRAR
eukprot:COSAG06_NODE_2734_length_6368_cov_44.250439_11_plen_112_part_00